MRILHFNQFGTSVGGVESYIREVSSALAAGGHESRLVSFAAEDPSQLMSGTVQVAAQRRAELFAALKRVIADFRPDAAYVHAVYDPRVVRWISERLATVAYVHSPYLVCPGYAQFLRKSERVCPVSAGSGCLLQAQAERCCFGHNPIRHWLRLRQVRSYIAIYRHLKILVGSTFMRELLQRNGLPEEQIDVLSPFLVQSPPPEVTVTSDPAMIVYAGRLTPEKGLAHLIRSLSSVHQAWRLVVAGDGQARAEYESLTKTLGLTERVIFLGWLDRLELVRLYQRSGFIVIPSLWPEPFGRVGPEAATCGRPAIAYDTGGVSDWLTDGSTGYLVPPGDLRSLSERISSMLGSPARQTEMGQHARASALAKWNSLAHAEKLTEHLLAARRGGNMGRVLL